MAEYARALSERLPQAEVTAVGGTMVFSAPKSHQASNLALPGFRLDVLREHFAGSDPGALAFPDSRGGPMRLLRCPAPVVVPRGD